MCEYIDNATNFLLHVSKVLNRRRNIKLESENLLFYVENLDEWVGQLKDYDNLSYQILACYFGLSDGKKKSVKSVAEEFNLNTTYISRKINSGLRFLTNTDIIQKLILNEPTVEQKKSGDAMLINLHLPMCIIDKFITRNIFTITDLKILLRNSGEDGLLAIPGINEKMVDIMFDILNTQGYDLSKYISTRSQNL